MKQDTVYRFLQILNTTKIQPKFMFVFGSLRKFAEEDKVSSL